MGGGAAVSVELRINTPATSKTMAQNKLPNS
jgi:hypothetical protein